MPGSESARFHGTEPPRPSGGGRPGVRRADGARLPPGFTLLEVVVALGVLGALLIVGLASLQVGMSARTEAAEHARLRVLAGEKLAQAAALPATDLRSLAGRTEGAFDPPLGDAAWILRIHEVTEEEGVAPLPPLPEPEELPRGPGAGEAAEAPGAGEATEAPGAGTGLFRITVEVRRGADAVTASTYVDRATEVIARRRAGRGTP